MCVCVCVCVCQWQLQGGFWVLTAEKTTSLPDDCDFVRAHASLTTFTMSINMTSITSAPNKGKKSAIR